MICVMDRNQILFDVISAIIHNIMGKNIFPHIKICRENIFFRLEEAYSSEQKLVSLQKSNILLLRNHLIQRQRGSDASIVTGDSGIDASRCTYVT